MSEKKVKTAAEWLALPEITAPVIATVEQKGSVCTVHQNDLLFVDAADCHEAKFKAPSIAVEKCALPTIIADFAKGPSALYRLPLELTNWAFSCIFSAQQGFRSFPAKVEFGRLDKRVYAKTL